MVCVCMYVCVFVCCVVSWYRYFWHLSAAGAMDSVSDFESGGCEFEVRRVITLSNHTMSCLRKTPRGKSDWTTTPRARCCIFYPHTEGLACTASHKRNLNNTNPSSRRYAYARFRHLTLCSLFLLYTRCQKDDTARACERCIAHESNASTSWHRTSVLRQYM